MTLLLDQKESTRISSALLVADAMMVAQREILSPGDKFLTKFRASLGSVSPSQLENILEEKSNRKCGFGSLCVLHYLYTEHADWFKYMALVTGHDTAQIRGESDRDTSFHHNPQHKWHIYFLVCDNEGIWYAGSPANHLREARETLLTKIISSKNLEEVMREISAGGGEWPATETIGRVLNYRYRPPFEETGFDDLGTIKFSVFTIDELEFAQNGGGETVEYGRKNGLWLRPSGRYYQSPKITAY